MPSMHYELQSPLRRFWFCRISLKISLLLIVTDACDYAMGGVLSQVVISEESNSEERPLPYFSKVLKPTETRYSTTEKELFAIVASIENWHYYLYDRHFVVRTDHQPL